MWWFGVGDAAAAGADGEVSDVIDELDGRNWAAREERRLMAAEDMIVGSVTVLKLVVTVLVWWFGLLKLKQESDGIE